MKIWAAIVTFNPNLIRFKKVISSIHRQVDRILIYDNCSSNVNEISNLMNEFANVDIIKSKHNYGLAYGLNRLFNIAHRNNIKWVLALDQDTICLHNHIKKMTPYLNIDHIGIICPVPIDERRGINFNYKKKNQIKIVKTCIQSGALYNIEIYNKIGGFEEWYFIDYIDMDYCMNLSLNGFKIIQVCNLIIEQEFGDIEKTGFFSNTKNAFLKRLSYRPVTNPMRVYYTTRNRIYYIYKYKNHLNLLRELFLTLKIDIKRILRAQNHLTIISTIVRGTLDGLKYVLKQR